MLDEDARRRLGALATDEAEPLDADARARIAANTRSAGPRIVRRAHVRRRVAQATWVALPTAALLLLTITILDRRPQPSVVAPSARTCSAFTPASGQFVTKGSDRRVLDLGALAFVSASPDAQTSLVEAAPCRTVLSLVRGRVTVHARDLGGGELVVRGDWGAVEVRGTVFAVEVRDDLSVEVAEGEVEVVPSSGVKSSVRRGRRASKVLRVARDAAPRKLSDSPLDAVKVEEILREVGLVEAAAEQAALPPELELGAKDAVEEPAAPVSERPRAARRARRPRRVDPPAEVPVEAPPPTSPVGVPEAALSADQLVRMAEQARRAGDLERARRFFSRAGASTGPTAEGAWIGLAKLEMKAGRAHAALVALDERKSRFGSGVLGPEATWIEVGAAEAIGDLARARRVAIGLAERWPTSEQARAAREWLGEHE